MTPDFGKSTCLQCGAALGPELRHVSQEDLRESDRQIIGRDEDWGPPFEYNRFRDALGLDEAPVGEAA